METLPSSGNINSSDAISAAVIKSCPEKIFAFPGEIIIFKVYSEPGINLKSAGLKFALNNSSIGVVCPPVYLCLFGARKYEVAYGCVYIKPGLATPVDTTITAKTNNGIKVEIPIEIMKSTLSISGHMYVGNGATLVKGFVKAYGPKGFCKLDASSGNYTLPRVFKSHGVTVKATWWTIEGGKTVRHREQRVIDFLNGDVTDLNFGVLPPTDQYYDYISLTILDQKIAWEEELGKAQGTQKTADWISGRLPGNPPPSDISDAIEEARVDEYEPYNLKLRFKSGVQICLDSNDDYLKEDTSTGNRNMSSSDGNKDSTPGCIVASDALTVKNEDVIMLGPAALQDPTNSFDMFSTIRGKFESRYGTSHVKCLHTAGKLYYYPPTTYDKVWRGHLTCGIEDKERNNVPRPNDFLDIDKYGVIYVYGHASRNGIMACPVYANDPEIQGFILHTNPDYYKREWRQFAPYAPSDQTQWYYEQIFLLEDFFVNVCPNQNFSGSIVCINGCESMMFHTGEASKFNYAFAPDAQVFLGYTKNTFPNLAQLFSYSFFSHMLDDPPLNVREAHDAMMNDYFLAKTLHIDTGTSNQNDHTYLPGDVSVTVHKDNPKGKVWQNGNK